VSNFQMIWPNAYITDLEHPLSSNAVLKSLNAIHRSVLDGSLIETHLIPLCIPNLLSPDFPRYSPFSHILAPFPGPFRSDVRPDGREYRVEYHQPPHHDSSSHILV
jgi:hypothetical protein